MCKPRHAPGYQERIVVELVTSDRKLKASRIYLLAEIERLSVWAALGIAVYPFGLAIVESIILWIINLWIIHRIPS